VIESECFLSIDLECVVLFLVNVSSFCFIFTHFCCRSTLPACEEVPLGVHAFYQDGMRLLLAGPHRNLYLATRQLRRAAEHPQVSEIRAGDSIDDSAGQAKM
jgi:hypothetical protein